MKSILLAPALGPSLTGMFFKNKIRCRTIVPFFRELGTFNSVTQSDFKHGNIDKLRKNKLIIRKENWANLQKRLFSVSACSRTQLMDLKVGMAPGLIKAVVQSVNCFLIQTIDKDFNLKEFVVNSQMALVVVSKLLSQLRFSELHGLLTDECLAEVEKNVRVMNSAQRYDLAVEEEDIYFAFPYDSKIIKHGDEGERTYFQVTVAYHIYKDFASKTKEEGWRKFSNDKTKFTTYNCRFIKEFTKGSNDQWIINGINLVKLPELSAN